MGALQSSKVLESMTPLVAAATFVLMAAAFLPATLRRHEPLPALAWALLGASGVAATVALPTLVRGPAWGVGFVSIGVAVVAGAVIWHVMPAVNRPPLLEGSGWRKSGLLVLFGLSLLAVIFLWANALHPPLLASAIFDWSAPAREGRAFWPLPLTVSRYYYALSMDDGGWKWLWALLSLVPWLGLYGAARMCGSSTLSSALLVAAPAGSFSLLFWGSSGHPDLFAAGAIGLASLGVRQGDRIGLIEAALGCLFAAACGGVWTAITGASLIAWGVRCRTRHQALAAVVAGSALLLIWAWLAPVVVDRVPQILLFLARDAWNPAKYGPIAYVLLVLYVKEARWQRSWSVSVLMPFIFVGLIAADLSSRMAAALDVTLRLDGSRLLAATLLLSLFFALEATGASKNARQDRFLAGVR